MAIHLEPNQKRKYIRIKEPIGVVIDEKTYKASDWSIGGFAIKEFDKRYDPGSRIPVKLLLPCQDGMLELQAEAEIIRKQSHAISCKFVNLSDRNTRIIFAFIDFFMDGYSVTQEAVLHRSLQPPDEQERQLLQEAPKGAVELAVRRIPGFNWAIGLVALALAAFLSLLLVNTISRTALTYFSRQQQYELVAMSRTRQAWLQLEATKVKVACAAEILSRLKASANKGAIGANQYSIAKRDLELLQIEKERLEDLLIVLKDNQRAVASGNHFYEMNILDRYQTVRQLFDTPNSGISSR